ncbi:MAG: DUF1206 domain-containing protein [Microlunatus sp.]|nr:DUF1206 domain-containing protein [Microlunatus sp.]
MDALRHRATGKATRAANQAGQSRVGGILISLGLISFGIVHLAVAWVALQLAWGHSPTTANQQGALAEMARTPVGPILLWILAIGFFALVLRELTLAVRGYPWLQRRQRVRKRWSSVGHAIVYGFFGVNSLRFAVGSGSTSGGGHGITDQLINNTAGRLLLLAVAAVVLGIGIHTARKGIRKDFREELQGGGGRTLVRIGQVGHLSKGIAVMIIGFMIGWATVSHHPGAAGGLDVAFHAIKSQPYGQLLLTVLAAGIACFGLYCFGWARRARRS